MTTIRRRLEVVALVPFAAGAVALFLAAGAGGAGPPAGCATQWWPQSRQSSCAAGSVTDDSAPSPANAARVKLAWSARFGGAVGNPVATGGTVYVVSGGEKPRLHALDLVTGRSKWRSTNPRYAVAGRTIDSYANGLDPIVDGDVLLRLSALGALRRYDMRTGRVFWRRDSAGSEGFRAPQAIADGNWYRSGFLGLSAMDARTGALRWRGFLPSCFSCGVAAAGGVVYAAGGKLGRGPSALYAFDAATGDEIWSVAGQGEMKSSSPLLLNGMVIVPTSSPGQENFIEAFRASDGKAIWSTSLGTSPYLKPLTLAAADEDIVVEATPDGFLNALDTTSGKLRWRVETGYTDSSPALANGVVWLVDGSDRLSAFAADDGRRLWSGPSAKGLARSSPVVAGGHVLVGTPDGRVLAYQASV